ncbi:MAG: PD-(D/E)XK nuclease family protein [Chthoniobacteraceae bacterium]
MSDPEHIRADYKALNELIVNCPDFDKLESLLGGFNLFQVLKFEHGEIRHTNVLAWILDPEESHGLDATFLKKWLMRVIHEAADETETVISAIDIDAWQLLCVEVRREWRNIDLLVILTMANGEQWIICIENKINSTQHSDQLRRYRQVVEKSFPDAAHRLYIFLTKSEEEPEESSYLPASFSQIHRTLKECLQSRSHAIGAEPKVLIENYLRLLEEKFMNESDIARTAQRIYSQHRHALDIIFEHRPDNVSLASNRIKELLGENAERLGIQLESSSKSYLRFIPKAWDVPTNTHGSAWAGSKRTVLFELSLRGSKASLYAIMAKGPEEWMDKVWEMSAAAPFKRTNRGARPRKWCSLHTNSYKVSLEDDESIDPGDVAQKLFEWLCDFYQAKETQQVISIISHELQSLESSHTEPTDADRANP